MRLLTTGAIGLAAVAAIVVARKRANGRKTTRSAAARVAPAEALLTWTVRIPETTPDNDRIYLCGSIPAVGAWDPAAVELERIEPGMYRCEVALPAGAVLHYKFTRGSWDTVEIAGDGEERPNRSITPLLSQHVLAQVDAWADQV